MYRALVTVQGRTLPLRIPVPPYEPYGLYRASLIVQGCTLPLPISLLPLWAVRPVQNLSACTRVHFTFTYTSTPPMDRTTCTEPQCLYKDALYLYLYLYSPYGPYDLYRASVTVQGCTLPLPIPLLPLWTVRPVQSLSACTAVHFTCFYFLGILEPKIISQWFEAFALLLCYSAFIGSSLPTFPDNLAVPYSSDCLTHSAAEA